METVVPMAGLARTKATQMRHHRIKATRARLLMDALEDRLLLSLPTGWASASITNMVTNYGSMETGSANASGGTFTVTSVGGNSFQYGLQYTYTTVTGNFDAKMRVTNLTNPASTYTEMAMMVREPTPASPNGTGFFDRNTLNGSWWGGEDAASWTFPFWYRVQRSGDVVTTYRSQDGSNWTSYRSTQLTSLAATVDLGIAVSSSPTATATVDNFTISPLNLDYATSWVGNTFGSDTGHVGYGFDAIAMDSFGNVHSIAQYDEGGSALNIYGEINGQPAKLGYKPGLDGVAVGGYAVAVSGNYEYYVSGGSTVRATPLDPNTGNFNWVYAGNPSWSYSGSSIHGLAVRNNELYISDMGNNKIVVVDALTGTQKRSWTVTRPGPLAFDNNGNLWVVQVYTQNGVSYDSNNNVVFGAGSNEGDQVNAYTPGSGSTPGTLLTGKTISGPNMRPCALYFDSTSNRLLVADNGPDLQIKGFTNLGAGTGAPVQNYTFGYQGGVYAGPNPGAVNDPAAGGNARFYHLSSIAMDAAGNIYVGMTWAGGELRKFRPDGTMVWTLQGLNFVQTAMIDPADDPAGNIFNVYTNREHYSLDLTKPVGQQSTLVGYTWDDYTASATWASGMQYSPGNSDNVMVRVNGQKYMFVGGATAWRFNGDIAIPTAGLWLDTVNNVFEIWHDTNNNGLPDGAETTTVPSDGMYGPAQYIDSQGGVWFTSGNLIKHFTLAGVDANGNLIYNSSNVTTFTAPAPFTGLGGLVYDAANDVMYIAGSSAEYPSWGNFPASGCLRISVRYDHWSQGNRTPTNTIVFPLDTVGNGIPGINMYHDVVYMDVAGQYLFAVLPWSSNAGNPEIYVYDKDHGNLVTILTPGPEVGGIIGNVDNGCKIHAFKRANGQYLISCEDDGYNKTVIYEWTPAANTSAPTVAPVLRVTSNSSNVVLNWDTEQSNTLAGFNIYRATTANGPYTKINPSLVSYNTYTDNSVVSGVKYYYKITAVNSVGEGVPSVALTATPLKNNAVNVGLDTTTLGSWQGVYGSQGYQIFGNATSLPAWAKVTFAGYNTTNASTTTNAVDLLKAGSTTSHAYGPIWNGSWNSVPMLIDINFTDGLAHKVSFYMQGSTGNAIGDFLQCVDATTGAVLNQQAMNIFDTSAKGIYASMNLTGHVIVKVYVDGYNYSQISGVFIDPASTTTTDYFIDPMRDKSLLDTARSTTGWTIGSTTQNIYNGDISRLYPSNTSAQYLTWKVTGATSFSTNLAYQFGYQSDISANLVLSTSPDGTTWTTQSLTHDTATVVPYYPNWNSITYSNSTLPAGTNYVRFQVRTPNVVDQIEVAQTTIGYTANAAPTINVAAAASPATTTTGTGVALSVTGADDGGATNLIYSWAVTGTAPGTVTFSANGTYLARNTTASFSTPGTYTLLVTVQDKNGATVTSSVNVTYTAALNAPSGLTATMISYSQINLGWIDNSPAETGFKIERATDSSFISNLTLVTTTAAAVTSYSDTGLVPNTTYYYRVRATSAAGDSVHSNSATASTPTNIPAAPSNLISTPVSTSQINLSWTDNATLETGMVLEYSQDINFASSVTNSIALAANTTSYQLTGLSILTNYYFRVRAINGASSSLPSLIAATKTLDNLPAAPTGLSAQVLSASSIKLTWTDNSLNETGFIVERATSANFTQNYALVTTTASNATTFTDTSIGSGATYYYRVRAGIVNASSAPSNTVTASSSSGILAGWNTANIGTVGLVGSASYSSGTFTVTASGLDVWSTADSFRFVYQPLVGDGQIIAKVNTFSAASGWAKAGIMIRESTAANANEISALATISNGVVVQYRMLTGGITGKTSGGTGSAPVWLKLTRVGNLFTTYRSSDGSAWTLMSSTSTLMGNTVLIGLSLDSQNNSATATATFNNVTVTSTLNPPLTLSATMASQTQINLSWTAVSGATSYSLYRSTTPNGEGSIPIVTGITGTSYSNTGLTANTTYYYTIATTNAIGSGNQSIEASAKTKSLAPTVATAASAVLGTGYGTPATLAVLGADDNGEAGLTYTWSVTSKPAGAADPVFSSNGTNAAKNSVASFSQNGSYTFRATITDADGQSVTSEATVNVTFGLTGGITLGSGGAYTLTPSAGNAYLLHITAGIVNLGSDLGTTVSLDLAANTQAILNTTQHLGTVTVATGAVVSLAQGGNLVLSASSLTFAGTGKLDLADNALILTASDQTTLRTYLANGQLYSSLITGQAPINGIGYLGGSDYRALHSDHLLSTQPVQETDVVAKYTLLGDVDLNGQIGGIDYTQLDASYLVGGNTNAFWVNGDFDYNHLIEAADYVAIDRAFGSQPHSQPLAQTLSSQHAARLGAAYTSELANDTATTFVENLYQTVLQRPADSAGEASWISALNNHTLTPAQVAAAFTGSTEYRANRVRNLYQTILGRSADAAGLAGWLSSLAAGNTMEQVTAGFYGSAEYASHLADRTPQTLIQSYYQRFLGRSAEEAGLNSWVQKLNAGTSAAQIAYAIMVSSEEGAAYQVRSTYQSVLQRTPTTPELQGWLTQLRSGTSAVVLLTDLLGSNEYSGIV